MESSCRALVPTADPVVIGASMESIEALVAQLQTPGASGVEHQEAFRALVACYQDGAYTYAYAILGDRDLAEDVAQEAFLTAFRSIGGLREPTAFPGWFRRIIRTHCHRLTRGKQLLKMSLDVVDDSPSSAADPTEILDHRELQRTVRAAIQALPERERIALLLFYVGGYSLAEIATLLNVPVTTVKKRLQYGRQRLKVRGSEFLHDSLEEIRPSSDSQFARRMRLLFIGDALAAEGHRAVDDLLKVDGVEEWMHAVDLHSLRQAVTQAGYRSLLEALLLDGVDPDDPDADGYTPLAWAAEYGDPETVSRLLPHRGARRHLDVDLGAG
jgi:RNA polymerase sigma factor (sigma-70 family)